MKSLHERKIKQGARPYLDEGEEVLAAFVARPRGWTQANAGVHGVGRAQQQRATQAGEESGLELASPMALAVTQRRLMTLKIGSPIGLGIGGAVKELVSAVPITDIDSVEIKRLAIGKVVTLTIRGGDPIKLEANALAGAEELAAAVDRAKATV